MGGGGPGERAGDVERVRGPGDADAERRPRAGEGQRGSGGAPRRRPPRAPRRPPARPGAARPGAATPRGERAPGPRAARAPARARTGARRAALARRGEASRRRGRRRAGRGPARRSRAAGWARRAPAPGRAARAGPSPRTPRARARRRSRAGRTAAPPPSSRRSRRRAAQRPLRRGRRAVQRKPAGASRPLPAAATAQRLAAGARGRPRRGAAPGSSERERSTSWIRSFGRSGRRTASEGAPDSIARAVSSIEVCQNGWRPESASQSMTPDGPDVGGLPGVLAGEPLRRDVGERARHVALRRERLRLRELREAEVEQPHRDLLAVGKQHVRGLHVAMEDAGRMRVREPVADLRARLDGSLVVELAGTHGLPEGSSRHELVGDVDVARSRARTRTRAGSSGGAGAPLRLPRARRARRPCPRGRRS